MKCCKNNKIYVSVFATVIIDGKVTWKFWQTLFVNLQRI